MYALDMRVHGIHIMYNVKMSMKGSSYIGHEFECSGTIAMHWYTTKHCIAWVCVHDTKLALRLVLNYVGSGIGRSPN